MLLTFIGLTPGVNPKTGAIVWKDEQLLVFRWLQLYLILFENISIATVTTESDCTNKDQL